MTSNTDPLHRLFCLLLADTPDSAAGSPWFCYCDLISATATGLRGVSSRLSSGERFTPRSLRSGGITSAYTFGVQLERIMRLSNHGTAAVAMRHYVDPLAPPTPAARVFFQRFVPALYSRPCRLSRSRLLLAIRVQPSCLPQPSYVLVSKMTL
jgi:hypothetical protein